MPLAEIMYQPGISFRNSGVAIPVTIVRKKPWFAGPWGSGPLTRLAKASAWNTGNLGRRKPVWNRNMKAEQTARLGVLHQEVPGFDELSGLEVYTVKSGDSMSKIAAKYGMTLPEITAANSQIANFNLIYPGQKVNVEVTKSMPGPTTTTTTVREGLLQKLAKPGFAIWDLFLSSQRERRDTATARYQAEMDLLTRMQRGAMGFTKDYWPWMVGAAGVGLLVIAMKR